MLQTGIESNPLFREFEPLLSPLGITIVDINRTEHGMTSAVSIIIKTNDHEVNVDDCAKVYNLVYPRLELKTGDRDLQLEVSTPGLQRNLRDVYEFSLFIGRRVRVYDSNRDAWISGIIAGTDSTGVTLDGVTVEDQKEEIGTCIVPFEQIHKAKLEYRWEDVPHVQ